MDGSFITGGRAACSVSSTARLGHNGGPDIEAQRLFEIIGPRDPDQPSVFQCGAPWTKHAEDLELIRLGKLQSRIERREQALRELRAERTKIMMRCIRRMRRKSGVE